MTHPPPKILKTVKESYGYLFSNIGLFLKVFFILIMGGVTAGAFYFLQLTIFTGLQTSVFYHSFYGLIDTAIISYFYAVCFMGWNRCVLIDAGEKQFPSVLKPNTQFIYFYKIFFLITIIGSYFPDLVSSLSLHFFSPDITGLSAEEAHVANVINGLFAGLSYVLRFLFFIFLCRYFLIFPAISVGKKWTLKQAAKASKNIRFRIFLSYILVILPIKVMALPFIFAFGDHGPANTLIGYFVNGIEMCLISYALSTYFLWHHRRLKENQASA